MTERTRAVCAGPLRRLRGSGRGRSPRLCEARGLALIEDAAHAPDAQRPRLRAQAREPRAWPARSASSRTRCSRCGEGGLLATDDDGVAETLPLAAARTPMTSGTWDRHRGALARIRRGRHGLQLPDGRAARRAADSAPRGPGGRHRPPPPAGVHRYRTLLADVPGLEPCPTATTRWTPPPAT